MVPEVADLEEADGEGGGGDDGEDEDHAHTGEEGVLEGEDAEAEPDHVEDGTQRVEPERDGRASGALEAEVEVQGAVDEEGVKNGGGEVGLGEQLAE